MSKTVLHDLEAREAILKGVDFLADVVKITEGPRGRNVILGQRSFNQSPKCTRDGVTVANYVDPTDVNFQLGADLIREAAQKTDNAVGDGTTASIVLAQQMIHTGFALINDTQDPANPMAMERGIHKATEAVIRSLRAMAVKVSGDKVFQVATVSAHGDAEIGRLVAEAIERAGTYGVVTAEPSTTSETYVESVSGIELEKSNLIHPAFITHPEEMKGELNNARVLLWEGVIATAKSLVPILKQVHEKNTPLLIVAGGYEAEALAVVINNRIKHSLPVIAVRMEHYGERRREVMRDIAALLGGKAYTEDMGTKIDTISLESLGTARKTVTTMAKTQIIDGKGNTAEALGRTEHIRQCLEQAAPAEKTILKLRLAALTGGITIIKVGGTTVTEMEEKKDRVIDAMSAAKAAVESGVVPGGGTALLQASFALRPLASSLSMDELAGVAVVGTACSAVLKQIAKNAGLDAEKIWKRVMDSPVPNYGFNALTGEYEDLVATGVIDPAKVVIEALRNAAAVACSILTMGAAVSENLSQEKTNDR